MPGSSTAAADSVVFKGRMMTLTVLEIRIAEIDAIAERVTAQRDRAPEFFAGMPVLISLPSVLPDLARVCQVLREAGLVVIGVLDAGEQVASAARDLGLGLMASPTRTPAAREPQPAARANPRAEREPNPDADAKTPTRLVTKPVRSGQQIYARGGDLVVTAAVSEGAEVVADGHIHIYGRLRGRALAGATGDVRARIFCRRFEPELVAIAGCYKVADAIEARVRRRCVQVRLDKDNLHIALQE